MQKDDKFGSNMDVKFMTKGGRQTQNIQIYKNIDALNQDAKNVEGEGGRRTYSMKQNPITQDSKVSKKQ